MSMVAAFQGNDSTLSKSLEDFCIRGLAIPQYLLRGYSRVLNYDAYVVHTKNDLTFQVSGPMIAQWEYRRGIQKVCSPEREEAKEKGHHKG